MDSSTTGNQHTAAALAARTERELQRGMKLRFGLTVQGHSDVVLCMQARAGRPGVITEYPAGESVVGTNRDITVVCDPEAPIVLENVLIGPTASIAACSPRLKNGRGIVIHEGKREVWVLGFNPLKPNDTIAPLRNRQSIQKEQNRSAGYLDGVEVGTDTPLLVLVAEGKMVRVRTPRGEEGWLPLEAVTSR